MEFHIDIKLCTVNTIRQEIKIGEVFFKALCFAARTSEDLIKRFTSYPHFRN